ncbi:MAG: response regulator [Actinobacteria bacterium]|nr:response regulator [Actinomycetota bacterium]
MLIAEDDQGVRTSLTRALTFQNYKVTAVNDGAQALEAVDRQLPDLVILDVSMPHVDGLTACRMIREKYRSLPILMLTARHEVSDRVAGLDAGADDYVVKPFALEELSARVRSMLRRTLVTEETQNLVVADLVLDLRSRTAHRGSRELILTKTEFDLLELLMQNVGIVLERDTLYDRIWGFNFETGSRSLDVYIGYLRRKTEEGGEARILHTIRGVGYIVRPPSDSDWEEKS